MKKIQCEVCGSTDIKRIDDSIFECQSCGVQYSKEEVQKLLVEITGKVKIDHTDEVQNNIKRGNQYEQSGDPAKAKEYYDKALDLDADNVEAQENIKKVSEMQQFDKYYIIEPDINPEDNVKDFLKQLAATENIACDIYKEISIKNVTEKFYTFLFMKGKYKCDWSLTACHRYYENETVYTEKYDPKTNKRYKEPETKKVERIERVPMHGTEVYETEQLVLGSNSLNEDISYVSESLVKPLIADFEQLQNSKYSKYTSKRIDPKIVEKENSVYKYCGIPLDLKVEDSVYNTRKKEMRDRADQKAVDEVMAGLNCDFCEGISATGDVLSQTTAYICLPVQVIEYTYKGKTYTAVSDLLSHTSTIPMIYPCDVELADSISDLNTLKNKAGKSPFLIPAFVFAGFGLLLLLIGMITNAQGVLIPLMLISDLVSIVLFIICGIHGKLRQKKFQKNAADIKKSLFNPRKSALEEGQKKFFEEHSDHSSAQNAAANMNCIEIKNTRPELAGAGQIREKWTYVTTNTEEDDTLAILQDGLKSYKRKRNIRLSLTFFTGAIIGAIGIALFSSYNFWYYTLWGIAMALCVGGFGLAIIGSIIVIAKSNKPINELKFCIEAHTVRLRVEQEGEHILEEVPFLKGKMNMRSPELVDKEVEEIIALREKDEALRTASNKTNTLKIIYSWIKKHKKLIIILSSVIFAIILSVVVEIIVINQMAKPYEKSLYGETFVQTEYDEDYSNDREYRRIKTYTFLNNNTYKYTDNKTYIDDNSPYETLEREGRFAVRFELFTGRPFLNFNGYTYSRYHIKTDSEKQINEFDYYSDRFIKSNGEISTNDEQEDNSSNAAENIGNSSNSGNNTSDNNFDHNNGNPNNNSNIGGDTDNNSNSGDITSNNKNTTNSNSNNNNSPNSSGSTNNNANTDPCTSGHNWVAITETVHHDEVGHYEYVIVKEEGRWYKCPRCGDEFYSLDSYYSHFDNNHSDTSFLRDSYTHGRIPAEYEEKWIIDKKAYDETVTTGYKCSVCGKTK